MSRTSTGAAPTAPAQHADSAAGHSNESDLSTGSLIKQGLAALAISALGLGVAGSVALTAAAQSEEVSQATVAGQGNPDTSQAIPAAQEQERQSQLPAVNAADNNSDTQNGDQGLDVFARKADGASRNAVRAELDRAVAEKYANDRGDTLTESGEKATDTSALAIQDNRSSKLQNNQEARKREQARLAEEKRKAEEALKKSRADAAAAKSAGAAPKPAAAGAAPAPDLEPATNAGAPAAAAAPSGSGGATTPMDKSRYSLGARWGAVGSWSRYHTGQDMSAPIGTPIKAVDSGVAKSPSGGGWAGTHAIIDHGDGSTLYAHMQRTLVRPGQQVKGGDVIGYVGMTGRSFGPHLHFEYYPAGASTSNPYSTSDPYRYMLTKGVRL